MSAPDPTEFVDGIVHEPTQTQGVGLDLTVADVRRIETPGRLDFGGDELEAPGTAPVETERRDPDDEYGWWNLDGGQYLIEYNETLAAAEATFVLQPRTELIERGAFHPTFHASELPVMPLAVADGGIRIKENARVTTVLTPEQAAPR